MAVVVADRAGSRGWLASRSLKSTLEYYSRHARNGEDPELHKRAAMSLGGLRVDPYGRVLHVDGDPLSKLYPAGWCASGIRFAGTRAGPQSGMGY